MRCLDLRELLSAYANGELLQTEQEFVEGHLSTCPICQENLESYTQIRRQISSLEDSPDICDIKRATLSRIEAEVQKRPARIWKRPVWQAAGAGVLILVIILSLVITLPSSPGQPETALAAEIALNSPDVRAAFGGSAIEVVETDVSDGKGTVICVAEMQPPIAVKVDLESKTVIEITDVSLPELTEAEKEQAIEIAKSDHIVKEYLGEASIADTKVYPFYTSGTLKTKDGEISLIPNPKVVVVELVLKGQDKRIRARIDLDAKMVNEVGVYQNEDATYPSSGAITVIEGKSGEQPVGRETENAKTKAIEIIQSDPIGQALLNQGFTILRDRISVYHSDSYLESESGETIAVSTPTSAIVRLTQGDEIWRVLVDLIVEATDGWTAPETYITHDPTMDVMAREAVVNLLQTDPKIVELLAQGAEMYINLRHYTEYDVSPEGEILVMSVPNSAMIWIVLGDELWCAITDLNEHTFDGPLQSQDEYLITAEEKEAVIRIVEAQSEVRKLLEEGAQIIFLQGGEMHADNMSNRSAVATLHHDGRFWIAIVNLDDMTFSHLSELK